VFGTIKFNVGYFWHDLLYIYPGANDNEEFNKYSIKL